MSIKTRFNALLAGYADEKFIIQRKAKALFIVNIASSIICLIYVVSVPFTTQAVLDLIVFPVGIFFLILSTGLLVKKRLSIASHITLSVAFFGLAAAGFFTEGTSIFAIYQVSLLLLFVDILALLIFIHRFQLWTVGILGIAVTVMFYFMRSRDMFETTDIKINALITAVNVLVIGFFIIVFLDRILTDALRQAEDEANRNRKKFERLDSLVSNAGDFLSLGTKLKGILGNTGTSISNIKSALMSIADEVGDLSVRTGTMTAVNEGILTAAEKFKNFVEGQNASVTESSAAIREMTASIESISSVSEKKMQLMRVLTGLTTGAEQEMARSRDAMDNLEQNAQEVLSITKVIATIAARTNLLAMNAAIEAAHAGDYGRGFAIVADEIRNLAESSNANLKTISNTIKTNIKDIATAIEINAREREHFRKISEEVNEFSKALEEINSGLGELSQGTGDIMNAVSILTGDSGEATENAANIHSMVSESERGIKDIGAFIDKLSEMMKGLNGAYSTILEEMNILSSFSDENIAFIEGLFAKIADIRDERS